MLTSTNDTIQRAQSLAARGRFRPAVDVLKALIRSDPLLSAPRLALAQIYRDARYPDQAGRWGVLEPGWATEIELDRFIRSVDAQRADPVALARVLLLPPGTAISDEILQIIYTGPHVKTRMPTHTVGLPSQRSEAEAARPHRGFSKRFMASDLDGFAIINRALLFGAATSFVFVLILVFGIAFVGVEDARLPARVGGLVTVLAATFLGFSFSIGSFARRHWVRAILALIAAVLGAMLVVTLAPIPGAYFPWELPR